MLATHIILAAADRTPLAPTRERLRGIVRVLMRVCEQEPLLAFHVSDSHIHLLVAISRAAAGRLAQRLALALAPVVGTALDSARFAGVRDQAHLSNTFEYILRNDEKHRITPDAWRENSALPDLLGLRVLKSTLCTNVRRSLPRIDGTRLLAMADWPALTPTLRLEGAAAAASAALALPDLRGRRAPQVEGCRAVANLVPTADSRSLQLELGRARSTVAVLRQQPTPPSLLRALGLQLSLHDARPQPADASFPTIGAVQTWAELPRFSR